MSIEIGIVIVDYHTPQQTINFINSQVRLCSVSNKIAVVVNDFKPEEITLFTNSLPCQVITGDETVDGGKNIFILPYKDNLGYAKGNNAGAVFLNKHFNAANIAICNNDLNFNNVDPFAPLINKMSSLPDVGVIGPKVVGFDNVDQSPHNYISLINKYIFRNVLGSFVKIVNKKVNYSAVVHNASEGYYYRIMGCFFIVNAASFFKAGMFDDKTFLFGEESILSERMLAVGKKCYYFPGVKIVHEHSGTISKFYKTRNRLRQEFLADKHYYSTYKKATGGALFVSRIFLSIYILKKRLAK